MAEIDAIGRDILRIWVADAVRSGPSFWEYGELACRVGRPGQGWPVAEALPRVSDWCRAEGLPDIAVMIVSLDKLRRGIAMPSDLALARLGGPAAIRAMQARVVTFDWRGWLAS